MTGVDVVVQRTPLKLTDSSTPRATTTRTPAVRLIYRSVAEDGVSSGGRLSRVVVIIGGSFFFDRRNVSREVAAAFA